MSNIPTQNAPQGTAQNPQILHEIQSEVSTEAAPLLQFLTRHAVSIMVFLGLFVVLLGGVGAYNWYQEKVLLEAQADMNAIVAVNDIEKRITGLKSFLETTPQELKASVLLRLADAQMQAKAYQDAAYYYGELATFDSGGAIGLLAALNQGQALILDNKGAEAIFVLEKILDKLPIATPEQGGNEHIVVQQAIAEAALQSNNTAKAQATFEAMATISLGAEADVYRYRARALKVLSTNP